MYTQALHNPRTELSFRYRELTFNSGFKISASDQTGKIFTSDWPICVLTAKWIRLLIVPDLSWIRIKLTRYSINWIKLTRQFDVLFYSEASFMAVFEKVQAKVIAVWIFLKNSKSETVGKISPYWSTGNTVSSNSDIWADVPNFSPTGFFYFQMHRKFYKLFRPDNVKPNSGYDTIKTGQVSIALRIKTRSNRRWMRCVGTGVDGI